METISRTEKLLPSMKEPPIALLFRQYLSSELGIVVGTLNVSAAFDEFFEKILACILAGLRF